MPTINKFEDLEVWQLARKVEQFTFELTKAELLSKDFKLKNQMNDSSSSIMSNIAEGFERGGRLEFVNFLSFAKSSAAELQSQYYNCLDRKYIIEDSFNEVYQMIEMLCKKNQCIYILFKPNREEGAEIPEQKN